MLNRPHFTLLVADIVSEVYKVFENYILYHFCSLPVGFTFMPVCTVLFCSLRKSRRPSCKRGICWRWKETDVLLASRLTSLSGFSIAILFTLKTLIFTSELALICAVSSSNKNPLVFLKKRLLKYEFCIAFMAFTKVCRDFLKVFGLYITHKCIQSETDKVTTNRKKIMLKL